MRCVRAGSGLGAAFAAGMLALGMAAGCGDTGGGPSIVTDAPGDLQADAIDAAGEGIAADTGEIPEGDLPGGDVATDGEGDVPGDAAGDATEDARPVPDAVDPALAVLLQQILDEYVVFSGDPGIAFAVRDGDQRAWSGTAGLADVVAGAPVTDDSRFRVGSNTKPIVATWILQLAEEGKVELDAPLTDYLPEYPQWSAITVRHLLGMQSGIPEYIVKPDLLAQLLGGTNPVFAPVDLLVFVQDDPLDFAPGTGGAYSNSNWILLGLIGEKASGRSARDEIRDRLLAPLGLEHTYLEQAGDDATNLVHGYMDLSVLVPLLQLPSAIFLLVPGELYLPGTQTIDANSLMQPSATWTAGAIVSTPSDLATFQRALQRGELLGRDMLAQMREWHPIQLLGGSVDYGLGLMRLPTVLGDLYGHGGLNFGFHVETYYSPDLDASFCHMHNFLPAQTAAVTTEVLAAFLADGADPLPACDVPEGFFGETPVDAPVMKVLFKGPVGEKDKPLEQQPGMSSTWATLGTSWVRLFGFDRVGIYSGATLSTAGLQEYVTMTSWGRGDSGDNSLRQMFWSVRTGLLKRGGTDGVIELAASDAYSAGALLMDYDLDANMKVTKGCIVAVTDLSKDARIFACEGAATEVKPGATLRLAGRLPLVTDTAVIDAVAANLQMTRCSCYDASQQPVACPEESLPRPGKTH